MPLITWQGTPKLVTEHRMGTNGAVEAIMRESVESGRKWVNAEDSYWPYARLVLLCMIGAGVVILAVKIFG